MPRAVEVLTNYLFSGRSREDRVNIINSIVSSGAETYEDIFTAMIFSKEYLLYTERPRSFEESLMPLLDSLKWNPEADSSDSAGKSIFEYMASGTTGPPNNRTNPMYLGNKGWHSMSLKIGRLPDVPLDALSFANYHKAVREELLIDTRHYDGSQLDIPGLIYNGVGDESDESVRDVISQLSLNDYIHFLFLNTLQRKASAEEIDGLINIYDGLSYLETDIDDVKTIRTGRYNDIALVTFDYISRLPELYYFKAVN
jgi:hypothetical protein